MSNLINLMNSLLVNPMSSHLVRTAGAQRACMA